MKLPLYFSVFAFFLSGLSACGKPVDEHAAHAAAAGHEIAKDIVTVSEDNFVDNFVLLDQTGKAHELYYQSDASAIVVMIQGNGCPIVRNAWSDFRTTRDEYESQGVRFYMLNANPQDSRSDLVSEAADYGYDVPILKDEAQLIAASLDVTRTAEVLVIDPSIWEIVYRGPVNDRLGYGRQRAEAREHYLKDAIGEVINGTEVSVPARSAKGCVVNLKGARNTAAHAEISYSDTIAPILMENCVSCHQPGGIGPWAMTDFEMVEGFAPTIRDAVRTRRMPPWSADPEIGTFHGARGLTVDEEQTLIRWIEAGAPRGQGVDPLVGRESDATVWPLGEPDLIVEAPAFDVPPTGIIDYQFPTALNPMDEDVWVRAITVVPGDKTVVHHALIGSSESITPPGEGDDGDVFENYLVGFVPGSESYEYPQDSGVLVKAGGEFRFQMHYTTSGRATTDVTKIGLYFHDEVPAHVLRQQVAINFNIEIPANVGAHAERAYFEFDNPAEIFLLFPHAHYRGKASKFDLHYPDGEVETILSVPQYDFNWQHNYALEEPITVPAGTRLVHETIYDNSDKNFANPDPDRVVPWGLQSADEMLYGSFFFRWSEETHDNPVHDQLAFRVRQYYGFADADMDGRLGPEEMGEDLLEAWNAGQLAQFDVDQDGTLGFPEFYQFQIAQRQRQAANSGNEN